VRSAPTSRLSRWPPRDRWTRQRMCVFWILHGRPVYHPGGSLFAAGVEMCSASWNRRRICSVQLLCFLVSIAVAVRASRLFSRQWIAAESQERTCVFKDAVPSLHDSRYKTTSNPKRTQNNLFLRELVFVSVSLDLRMWTGKWSLAWQKPIKVAKHRRAERDLRDARPRINSATTGGCPTIWNPVG